ncbi:MOSC domain-containing protein [Leptolyngbya sp. 7M]|uniref:MOSC domain-containing protein n=1 Tax=Leptolyngbya sp. 7M TaxID=2812896 RepID=UPI001B8A8EF8|nr:MOSC N-terminal beta barrel domain-containing protein [Leptolyngbya sp. 7M]QYO62264.1 MOSC domain-containing protein [Leptolyngbya sp. 7M]
MKVSEINIYPIKSLAGIPLESAIVERRGLRFDRRWMLTDKEGLFFTQREVPAMATIAVGLTEGGLVVSANGFEDIQIPFEPDLGERLQVRVWRSEVLAEVYRGAVSEWFSDVLRRNCKLVRMPEYAERHVSERFDRGDDIVSFADGYPLLLIGEGSLAELNERLQGRYHSEEYGEKLPLPMNRFRPNIVVQGSDPFEEDGWARIKVREAIFRVVKPCARCVVTTVDQKRGEFDGKEPLKTLAGFRMAKDVFPDKFEELGQTANAVLFGENLIPDNPGASVRIGDEIEILESRRL